MLVIGVAERKVKSTNKSFVDYWVFAITVENANLIANPIPETSGWKKDLQHFASDAPPHSAWLRFRRVPECRAFPLENPLCFG